MGWWNNRAALQDETGEAKRQTFPLSPPQMQALLHHYSISVPQSSFFLFGW